MRRAGVLVVSVLLTVLTGCEPGGGDTAAPPTSTAPDLEAHTNVLELVRAADEAAKQRGTVSFQLRDGTPPQRDGGEQAQPDGGQGQPGGAPNQPSRPEAPPLPGGAQPQPNDTPAQPGGPQAQPNGPQPQPGGPQPQQNGPQGQQDGTPAQPQRGPQGQRGTPPKPLPLAAGRLAYGEQGVDVLVRTLRRPQNFEFRAIDGSVFTQPTGQLVPIARGMPWLRLDATPTSPLAQLLDPALLDAPNIVDPTQTFDLLVAAGTIASSERATLGGAEVTRYDIDLDVEQLAEHIQLSSGDQPRPFIVTALRTLAEQGTTTAPVTLFLDRHNLPRRITLPGLAALPQLGSDALAANDLPMLTVNYRNWGKPPRVAVPPAGTVATVPG